MFFRTLPMLMPSLICVAQSARYSRGREYDRDEARVCPSVLWHSPSFT